MRALIFAPACLVIAGPALAQDALDRADPYVIQRELPDAPAPDVPEAMTTVDGPLATPAPVTAPRLMVGAVRVVGLERLRPADFAQAIEPFLGRELDRDGQVALVSAVAEAARRRGYVLASAAIEPQSLSAGVLRVRVDEGRVDAIRLVGTRNRLVERTLLPLAGSGPVTIEQLERRLLLAGDVAGARVGAARLVREGSFNILTARVDEVRFAGSLSVDNWGTRIIGPVNAQTQLDGRGLLTAGDTLSLIAAGTPLEFREYRLIGGRYLLPLDADGTTLELTGIRASSRPGGRLRLREIAGESANLRADVQHALIRRFDGGVWAGASLQLRDVDQDVRGLDLRSERAAQLSVRLVGSIRIPNGVATLGATATRGFAGTRAGDPLASREDGDARFTKVELRGAASLGLGGPFSLALSGEAQVASRALLVGDEMGLGGSRFGRGFDFRERSGDEGVAGSAELRWSFADRLGPFANISAYGFGDGGRVWNLGLRDGQSGTLYSAGGGLKARIADLLSASVELGFPLNDDRRESGNRRPRLSFETSVRF